jgi:hypothetical protein
LLRAPQGIHIFLTLKFQLSAVHDLRPYVDKQFANLKNTMGAIRLLEADQAQRNKITPAMAAGKASRAAAGTLESTCFQWQLSYLDF